MEIRTSEINPGSFKPGSYKKIYLAFLLAIVFVLGVQFGRAGYAEPGKLAQVFLDQNRQNAPKDVNWQLLWDAIDQVKQKYVTQPLDMQKVLYGAVSGAVASLGDPYTVFLPPQEAKNFQDQLKGDFEGIGAEIAVKNQQLVVVSPIDGSPAQKAGLKSGDYIYKVDGQDTSELTLDEAVSKIRGPAGTQVDLQVFHKGNTKPTEFKITRQKIEIKSVSYEIKQANGKKIGYMKLQRFGDDTSGLVQQAVSNFLVNNVNGVIVDLRDDPGGYLETAVDVASNWIPEGQTVVIQKYGDGTQQIYPAKGTNRLGSIPTVVLINGGSASASEILSGALQDHNLAKLVGEKSFGKGSVQQLFDLRDSAQVKVTIAKWLTPKGHDLNKEGLEPDVKITMTDDDFQNGRDPQLDKTLEILAPKS
jgi:carboxyl-terminal processing protease